MSIGWTQGPNGELIPAGGGDPLGQSLMLNGPSPGTSINTTRPQIFGPQNSPIPLGKSPVPRSTPPRLPPYAPSWLPAFLARLGIPGIAAAGAAAGIPATQKWNATTDDLFLRDPNNAGGIPPWFGGGQNASAAPAYRPEDSPSFTAPNPYGAGMPRGTQAAPIRSPMSQPNQGGGYSDVRSPSAAAPVAATPAAVTPKAPPSVNLGYYTGSMGGPQGSAAGGARNPQWLSYTANDPRLYQGT